MGSSVVIVAFYHLGETKYRRRRVSMVADTVLSSDMIFCIMNPNLRVKFRTSTDDFLPKAIPSNGAVVVLNTQPAAQRHPAESQTGIAR